MNLNRPDLEQATPEIRAYIEALEAELARLNTPKKGSPRSQATFEISEPPTSLNLITLSRRGLIKRTPRHLYERQRRGGMGIVDLENNGDDPPTCLTIADESENILVITNRARGFHLPVKRLKERPVRSRGGWLTGHVPFEGDEQPRLLIPIQSQGYLILVTESGQVRRVRHHFFKNEMRLGNTLYSVSQLGPPVAACWSSGDGDLFIATRQGQAIRFAEQKVPFKGCLGLRLKAGDAIVSVTPVQADSGVFLLNAEGKGIIRLMSGFRANKAPGAGGKLAMKTDGLVAALAINQSDDVFIASRLGKIIRFQAAELSTTEGVVQGVHCISFRADEAVTAIDSHQA